MKNHHLSKTIKIWKTLLNKFDLELKNKILIQIICQVYNLKIKILMLILKLYTEILIINNKTLIFLQMIITNMVDFLKNFLKIYFLVKNKNRKIKINGNQILKILKILNKKDHKLMIYQFNLSSMHLKILNQILETSKKVKYKSM